MIEVVEVKSGKDLRKFIQFPIDLYRGDPNFVPELHVSQKKMFNRKKYPFFEHSKVDFFLAICKGSIAGRIALIRNNNHIIYSGEKCGFFGFFESVEDYEVTCALLDKAVSWTREEMLESIAGPENFTTNDSCGFLTEGFYDPPVFMMPYNKPYYSTYLERYGFSKKLDLVSYLLPTTDTPGKIIPVLKLAEERARKNSIKIRPINLKDFENEITKFREIYNYSYKNNWGFVPLTDNEFRYQAQDLKRIADPGSVIIAEKDGFIIAFLCAVPDLNQILINVKGGRLFPFGFIKLMTGKNKISRLRILILGVHPEYRNTGIDALLYESLFDFGRKNNIKNGEAGYVMENNPVMNSILISLGGQVVKKYRLYEYRIAE